MTKYILKRIGQGLLTVFLTVSTVFVLIRLAPGDPAVAYAGPLATTEELAKVREQFGLDLPLIQQYWIFLQELFTGNLGTSYSFQAPAIQVVLERLPYTLTLATASILLTAVVAIPLGVWMSRRPDTKKEFGVNVLTIAGQSMPDFWTGIMLLTFFAVLIPIFPASGFATWSALVLPTVTIAILQIALISRMVRREMTTNFAAPYLTVARSRGVRNSLLTWRYAMGNSAIPVFTALSAPASRPCSTAWWWWKWCSRGPASAP